MAPPPDHGADTYVGSGVLTGRKTVITGGDSGIGRAVAPGPVRTPLIPATMPDTTEFGKQSPLGRPAQPAETAPASVFLASPQASHLTGEIVNATGGTPLPWQSATPGDGWGSGTAGPASGAGPGTGPGVHALAGLPVTPPRVPVARTPGPALRTEPGDAAGPVGPPCARQRPRARLSCCLFIVERPSTFFFLASWYSWSLVGPSAPLWER
ncbi:hypothetical protein YW7DRAFT_04092 [Streptomyces sp. AmelKG-E11A]|nr:hypothetical protein YW7DRAFT_04092 [Streptomyces sp. AmelKG-E11A]